MDHYSSLAELLNTDINTAKIYFKIVSNTTTENEIANIFPTYMQSLDFLKENRLIIKWDDSIKVEYMAIPPELGLSAILLSEAWKLDSNLHSLEDVRGLSEDHPLRVKLNILEKIAPLLTDMYTKHLPTDSVVVYEAQGKDLISSNLASQISSASKVVKAVSSPPHLMGEVVWSAIRNRMDCGVAYERITVFDELVRHGYKITKQEIADGCEKLFVAKTMTLKEKYYIIDDERVAIFVPGRTSGKFKSVQFFINKGISNNYCTEFRKLCEKSIPVYNILPYVEAYRENIRCSWIKKYSPEEVKWLLDIFDYGVFYSKSSYAIDFINLTTRKMIDDGTVKKLNDNNVIINYSISSLGLEAL